MEKIWKSLFLICHVIACQNLSVRDRIFCFESGCSQRVTNGLIDSRDGVLALFQSCVYTKRVLTCTLRKNWLLMQYSLWFILYKTLFFNYWIEIIHTCCWHLSLNFNCMTSLIQGFFSDWKVWIPSLYSSYANYSMRFSLTEN